jgi:lipopolysaccharide heptosyltransferase II
VLSVDRQRWVDATFGPPICWLLTVVHRLKGDQPPAEIRRLLVIVLSEMGALVLARPMFDRLREKYPHAEVFVLCFAKNRGALDLLDVVPQDHVIGLRSGSLGDLFADSRAAINRIRELHIDVVLDLELFARASAIYAALSGAPIRVGFHRHTQEGLYRGDFINRPVLYNSYQHISQQFITLAEAIDSTAVPKVKRLVPQTLPLVPRLALQPGELETAGERLAQRYPVLAGRKPVFLCPGAGLLPIRAWPLAHYIRVAQSLIAKGLPVAVVGLPEDRELARSIQVACGSDQCIDLTGYTRSVRELTVLLHLGALLLTNDGGTGHFAALTPIPTIVLYGPETPALYGSLGEHAVNMQKPLSCSPCLTAYNHRTSPCDGDNICLKSISPEEVLETAYRLLGVSTHA